MRKFLKAVIICTALLGVSNGVHAVGQRVEYVNGIQNTRDDAIASLHKIECTLMDGAEILQKNPANTSCFNTVGSPNHRPVKRDFVVDYTWNPIGWWGTVDITDDLQDWQELFTLKTVEERCIGLLLALKQAVSANDSVAVANTAMPLQNYASNLLYGENSSNNELVRDGDVDAARMALTQGVISGLLDKMSATDQTIIVAHSEGNLLAHLAYAKFAALLPVSAIKNVRIVNVGNTAQFSMHDLNLTNADDDALYGAVSGLKHLADRFDWIRTTPSCNDSDCDFAVDSPTMKAPEGSDFYDHDFKEVYLSDREVEVNEWRGVNYTPDKRRFRDRFEDLVYTAADSLDDAQQGWRTVKKEDFNTALPAADFWLSKSGVGTPDSIENGLLKISTNEYSWAQYSTLFFDPASSPVTKARIRIRYFVPTYAQNSHAIRLELKDMDGNPIIQLGQGTWDICGRNQACAVAPNNSMIVFPNLRDGWINAEFLIDVARMERWAQSWESSVPSAYLQQYSVGLDNVRKTQFVFSVLNPGLPVLIDYINVSVM